MHQAKPHFSNEQKINDLVSEKLECSCKDKSSPIGGAVEVDPQLLEASTLSTENFSIKPKKTGDDSASTGGKMQEERREYKYILRNEAQARNIRHFVMCHLVLDDFTLRSFIAAECANLGKDIPDFSRVSKAEMAEFRNHVKHHPFFDSLTQSQIGYEVHSVYLDNIGMITCRATKEGFKDRFKLRVRFYDDNLNNPAFLEVKERHNQITRKYRAGVSKETAERMLRDIDYRPTKNDLLKSSHSDLKGLQRFCDLRAQYGCMPERYTSYRRVGLELPGDNEVRVTFDSAVRGADYSGRLDVSGRDNWPMVNFGGIVLELKFCGNPPWWMSDLVQEFNLERGTAAKYVGSVDLREIYRDSSEPTL